MENGPVPQWVQHFMQAVYEMRVAQKDYFSLPSKGRLKTSKGKESCVDDFLKKAIGAGAIDVSKTGSEQQNLFHQ